jgi:hypothetical protein
MQHLDEQALEAFAGGREDLLSREARAHVEECEPCRELAEREREMARETSVALKRTASSVDGLDAMISKAMAKHADPSPSRRSLIGSAAIGAFAASVLALLSLPGASSLTVMGTMGRQGVTLARAADRAVEMLVPGGWIAMAILGFVIAVLLALPVQLLLGDRKVRGTSLWTSAIIVLLICATFGPAIARAHRVEGAWPETPLVTVDADARPTSEVLRMAAESAGLGLIVRLPEDPPVTIHVREAPLADVVGALLGDADVVVIPSASLLTIRPDAPAQPIAAEPAPPAPLAVPSPPPVPQAPPEPSRPATPEGIGDRVTFGDDVHIREHESVRDVLTMGGNARIDGHAYGDVVTMGGDADVRGEVVGNLTTMGGSIRVRDGARVHGDLNAMGGEIDVDDDAQVHGQVLLSQHAPSPISTAPNAEEPEGFFRWGLWHALLFLAGLVLLGTSRQRLDLVRTELADRPIRNMFGGSFAMLAGVLLAGVLLITIIGSPGSVIIGIFLFIAGSVGWIAAGLWIANVLPIAAIKKSPILQLGVGLGVLFLIGLIPHVGVFLTALAALAGFGAVMATKLGKIPRNGGRRHIATGPFKGSR